MKPPDPLIGRVISGRYRVVTKLGEGRMGGVYLAEQVAIGMKVALKVLRADLAGDEETVRRFRQEARLAAAAVARHRSIVTVFDFDQTDDGSLFIAMEYVHGTCLSDLLRERGPLPARCPSWPPRRARSWPSSSRRRRCGCDGSAARCRPRSSAS